MWIFFSLFLFYGKSPYGRYPPERVIPQSATILAPVIALDSGDNKKRTIFAISIGLTILPIGDKLITSPTSDSILDGITRKSIIELAKFHNIDVLEREITIDEILKEHKSGNLKEIFGSGTAVVVLPIKSFGHRDQLYTLSSEKSSVSSFLKEKLNNIQYNISNEFKNWKFKIN